MAYNSGNQRRRANFHCLLCFRRRAADLNSLTAENGEGVVLAPRCLEDWKL